MIKDIIYEYDGSFEGLLCCVFDCYTRKENPVSIYLSSHAQPSLFESHVVISDERNAERIYKSLIARSPKAAVLVKNSYLTCVADKEIKILNFIRELYKSGAEILFLRSCDAVYPLITAVRHLQHEVELYKGIIRFSEFNKILVSEIEPQNRILPVLRFHFCHRFAEEEFMIYDKTHKEMLFYSKGKASIVSVEEFEMSAPEKEEAAFRRLWKRFFDTIAIKERINPKCQMTHLPKRYRSKLTEFMGEEYFIPRKEDNRIGAQAPFSQGEIPEPEKPSKPLRISPESSP